MSTFVKISNEQIYDRLVEIEKKIDGFKSRVRLVLWVSSTALTLALAALLSGNP